MKDVHLIYGLGLALTRLISDADARQRPGGGSDIPEHVRVWADHFNKWTARQVVEPHSDEQP